MKAVAKLSLEPTLAALNAAGEETRLRLLALLAQSELTVSEIMAILGQSQPRVSRHLKLLVEAGLVERRREGAWAFFRLSPFGPEGVLARAIVGWLEADDALLAGDRARLTQVRHARAENAARYFAAHAEEWDRIRALHVPEERVEEAMRDIVGGRPVRNLLDLGAGEVPAWKENLIEALFVRPDWAAKNEDTVRRMVRALDRGNKWVAEHSAEEIAKTLKVYFPSISPEALLEAARLNKLAVRADGKISKEAAELAMQLHMSGGGMKAMIPFEEMFTDKYH